MSAKDSDQQPLHTEDKQEDSGPDDPPKKKTCTGYCCYKVLVVLYSLLFLIIGIILFGVGVWIGQLKSAYESINDAVTAPVILAVVLGVFMIVFAFIGVIGALKEKIILLKIFFGIAIVVFLGQVIIGILAFIYREETINVVSKELTGAIKKYTTDDDVTRAVNHIQQKFSCCGLKNARDWDKNEFYSCDGDDPDYRCGVPDSCCVTVTENCGQGIRNPNNTASPGTIFRKGCTVKFRNWVEQNLDIVGATALGLTLLHILGIFLVYFYITSVQDRVWLFKYRKRYYNNN